jgi:hypothetical protein
VTVVGVAFAVHPIHASHTVFLLVLGGGAMAIAIGCGGLIRGTARQTEARTASGHHRLLERDCHGLGEALVTFALECARERPRQGGMLWKLRDRAWRDAVETRYRDEFRSWALRVFEAAVALGVVSPHSRPLVQAPAATQLEAVCELFRDIEHQLQAHSPGREDRTTNTESTPR